MNSRIFQSQSMHILFCSIIVCALPSIVSSALGNETDHMALLSFKAGITLDPLQVTPSWNDSTHFCNWIGITCSKRHQQRVVAINLWSGRLSGSISPAIGNLSFLEVLLLHNNSLTGTIPEEIGKLSRLKRLGIGNNSFSGEIPANISRCLNLIELDLSGNNLEGIIPVEFKSLTKLFWINLHSNKLTGQIPDYIGNFTSLTYISLLGNHFQGRIPDSLGRLTNLWFLGFASNNLSGTIPASVLNISSLTNIDLPNNHLEGTLPSDLALRLPELVYFNIPINDFGGPIPVSISNASKLEVFAINNNYGFTGSVPDFSGLKNLKWLALDNNQLGNGNADNLNFLSSLVNCTRLFYLGFGHNNLGGVLPKLIGNFSQLSSITMGVNLLSGNIPSEMGQLVNLERLYLTQNHFTGSIPDSIGRLFRLRILSLSRNNLSGSIPLSLGNLTLLTLLYLRINNLEGSIPSSLAQCTDLLSMDLSENNLSSRIPEEIFGLSSLSISLDLSSNQLTGPILLSEGALRNLVSFDVSNNLLSGALPSSLGSYTSLTTLSMASNFFRGIPSSLSSLRGLEVLDLSRNNLTGRIPAYFTDFRFLKNLNLSFNDFEGEVPDQGIFTNMSVFSVDGNGQLCGGVPDLHLQKCILKESSRKGRISRVLIIVLSLCSGILLLILVMSFIYVYKRRRDSVKGLKSVSSEKETLSNVSYGALYTATDGFSPANLIGSGKFSSVYKGNIIQDQNGTLPVAVKVLDLQIHGASKSFVAECEALRSIRHRNLVKIITSCSSVDYKGKDFKALVYSYMVNGSLEGWLHQNPREGGIGNEAEESRSLSLLQRLNIVIDVANALDYLHHQCGTPLVHCDLKPSNVLLDIDMVAHLGDFGLARFLLEGTDSSSSSKTSSQGLKGTFGYAAPEYGMGSKVSTYGDVYSYGILILEIFTGKSPTDEMFNDGLNLHNFVKVAIPDQVMDICDPLLVQDEEEEVTMSSKSSQIQEPYDPLKLECLISVLKLGIACSMDLPRERVNIGTAINELHTIKEAFAGSTGKSSGR